MLNTFNPVIGSLIFAACVLVACNSPGNNVDETYSFSETLDIHLNAIQTSNLEKLEPTVADNVSMISPQGDKIESKEKFMTFHDEWFELNNWEWKGNILNTEYSDSLGYGLIQYEYIQKDSSGNIQFRNSNYLVLIFKNSKEGWKLIHDQNTEIHND